MTELLTPTPRERATVLPRAVVLTGHPCVAPGLRGYQLEALMMLGLHPSPEAIDFATAEARGLPSIDMGQRA